VERATNSIGDLISGVTLTLLSASATAVQVTVTDDTDTMQEEITTLVEAYNEVVAYIKEQADYNATTEEAGILFGNYGVQIVKSQLGAIATGNAPGFQDPEDSYLNLAQIGITTDADQTSETFGQLVVDEATLTEALSTNPQAVADLLSLFFGGVSDDASGTISYYSSLPGITQPGMYEVVATVSGGCSPGAPLMATRLRWKGTP